MGLACFQHFFPSLPMWAGEYHPFHSWLSQQPALQEVATAVEGLIALKSRTGKASRSDGAGDALGVAPGCEDPSRPTSVTAHGEQDCPLPEGTATLVSMRNNPSEPHAAVLRSPPPLLLGNPQSSGQGQLKVWRAFVCVDFSSLGDSFLEEEFPGEPALMDRNASFGDMLLPARQAATSVLSLPPMESFSHWWRPTMTHHIIALFQLFILPLSNRWTRKNFNHLQHLLEPWVCPALGNKGKNMPSTARSSSAPKADEHQVKLEEKWSIMLEISLISGLRWYIEVYIWSIWSSRSLSIWVPDLWWPGSGICSIPKGPDFWEKHHIRKLKHSKQFSSDLRRGCVTSASGKVFTEAFGECTSAAALGRSSDTWEIARKTKLRTSNAYLWTPCKKAIWIHHNYIRATDGQMPCYWCKNKKARISLKTITLWAMFYEYQMQPGMYYTTSEWPKITCKALQERMTTEDEGAMGKMLSIMSLTSSRQAQNTCPVPRHPQSLPLSSEIFSHLVIHECLSSLGIIWLPVVLFLLTNFG